MRAVIAWVYHVYYVLTLVHVKVGGKIYAQNRRLGVVKVVKLDLIDLLLVGKQQQLVAVISLERLHQLIIFLELLLAAHTQRLRCYFLEIALAG